MYGSNVTKDTLLSPNTISLSLTTIGATTPLKIYLPKWGYQKEFHITQCTDNDIIVDVNSDNKFFHRDQLYSRLVIKGCEESIGLRFRILGNSNQQWIVRTTASTDFFTFES